MATELRSSGIPFIDDVPWGAHLCLFYETTDDLIDAAAGYFTHGLAANELCIWVIPDRLQPAVVTARLREAIADFDAHVEAGRLRFVTRAEWHGVDGGFELERAVELWDDLVADALARGHAGLRASADAVWLLRRQRDDVLRYARRVAHLVAGRPALALCTYDLAASRGIDVLDIARLHNVTVARRRGEWQPLETPRGLGDGRAADDALELITAVPGHDLLTERERTVLPLLLEGASNKEVARDLGISPRTAEFHRANIIGKLGAKNTADVIRRVFSRR